MRARTWITALDSHEIWLFLAVGGAGYVVDVGVFNLLNHPASAGVAPVEAKTVAVAAAMVVTFAGNRYLTWRSAAPGQTLRQLMLFVVFNAVGWAMSVVFLLVSHDLFGLTSRLADNVSANVLGLAAGTAFRFWAYRRFVFDGPTPDVGETEACAGGPGAGRAASPTRRSSVPRIGRSRVRAEFVPDPRSRRPWWWRRRSSPAVPS